MNIPKPKTYYVWKHYGNDVPFTDITINLIAGTGLHAQNHTHLGTLTLGPNNSFAHGFNNSVGGINSVIIGGANNTLNGNNSAIIGGNDITLNDDRVLAFDGDIRLMNDRRILSELDELRTQLAEIKEIVQSFVNGN